jgi:Protein of unknown function (DUF1433)
MNKKNEQNEVEQYWHEQEPRVTKFFKYNFNNIDTITFDYETVKISPMGLFNVKGYINDDKLLWFIVSSGVGENNNFDGSVSCSVELGELIKKEYKYESKSVTEIEAEEAKQKEEQSK